MYSILQSSHSHTRWLIFLAALLAIIIPFLNQTVNKKTKLPALILLILCDLQLLMGVLLYFIYSPFGSKAFENGMGFVMKTSEVRKIAVEHFFLMLLAIALVHIGYAKIKKLENINQFRKTGFLFFGIALLLILAGIPWSRL